MTSESAKRGKECNISQGTVDEKTPFRTRPADPSLKTTIKKYNVDIKKYIDVPTGEVKASGENVLIKSNGIGSCVVVVAYDSVKKTGALAHVMLPGTAPEGKPTKETKYAANAIEEMIIQLTNLGTDKEDIEICLAGGANVLDTGDDTIARDVRNSVLQIVEENRLIIKAKSIGGKLRRTISLDTNSGRVYLSVGEGKIKLFHDFDESKRGVFHEQGK